MDTCGFCEKALPAGGPSPDFCNAVCQRKWQAGHDRTEEEAYQIAALGNVPAAPFATVWDNAVRGEA